MHINTASDSIKHKKNKHGFVYYIKQDWRLYTLLLLPMLYFLIFKYIPMYGVTIAFKDFNLFEGIFKSPWVGLEVFREIFAMKDFFRALRNTLALNVLDLLITFPAPIILAIVLNELRIPAMKKGIQMVLYLPRFISWVIIGGISYQLFAENSGIVNKIITAFGFESLPFLTNKWWWLLIYVSMGVWQSAGWNTIIYMAAMTGIDSQLYEAAEIDGAGKFSQIVHITLPGISSTIIMLLIINVGQLLNIGFERPFVLGNVLVQDFSEVVSTFVYKVGLQSGRFSIATAIGFFQSVVGLILISAANLITNKSGEQGIW